MAWGLIVLPTSNCYSSQLSRIVLLGLYVLHESSSVWQSDTWFCWFSVVWDVLSSAVSGSGAGSFCCLLCKFLDISPAVHLPLNAVHEPPFNFFCGQRTSNLFSDHNILVFYVPWNNHLLFGVLIVVAVVSVVLEIFLVLHLTCLVSCLLSHPYFFLLQ